VTLDADHPPGPTSGTGDEAERRPQGSDGPVDADQTPTEPTRSAVRRRGGSAGLLGAAMLAVGEILEPEKTVVEIVQTDDEPLDDLPFGLDFGDLPPLD